MPDKEMEITRTEIKTFRARIKATKPHWVQKVISYRKAVIDGLHPQFKTYITVFMPKLNFKNKKPVTMLHISNGGGSCLLRAGSPTELANELDHFADILRSDVWLDMYQQLQNISDNLIESGSIVLDQHFVDVPSFKKAAGLEKHDTGFNVEVEV